MSKATNKAPRHRLVYRDPQDLVLGAHYEHVDYCWRPYGERPEDHREDYDRLFDDIKKRGIINPLICHGDNVLIGMRRCEIAVILEIPQVPVWDILDDISEDWTPARVFALRDLYADASY